MSNKSQRPSWFKIWLRQKPIIDAIPDDAAGRVIKAALAYFDAGKIPKLSPIEAVAFAAIRPEIDQATADYMRDVENGKKGGRPRISATKKPPVTEGNPPFPKVTEREEEIEERYKTCAKAVQLLNDLSGSSFRATTKATQKLIAAREKDGYTSEDIEMVIRHQCNLWSKDATMRKYRRPETLFGAKFEGYLSDARRNTQVPEQGYTLAPFEDPWEVAMRNKWEEDGDV